MLTLYCEALKVFSNPCGTFPPASVITILVFRVLDNLPKWIVTVDAHS
jgi:hypothetical protein